MTNDSLQKFFRSEVAAMSPYTPGEQPQTGKVIKLNTNENPYPPSPRVVEAIHQATSRLERYPDPLGTAFRRAAADVLNVDPEMILCGNGSDDCLTVLTRAFVGDGQKLRLPYPSYILYRTLAELQSAQFEEVAFDKNFGLSESFYTADQSLKLIYLPNPNSPSGTLIDHASILRLADSVDCPVVVDEAYVDFAPTNCIELIQRNPKIIITRTFSKSYALAGLRFGYLVAHPDMVQMMRKVKDSYNTDMLSLAGATAAISDQAWLKANVAKIIATRTRMMLALRELGFDVIESHANFLWCTRSDRPLKPIYEQLKKNGILVRYMNYPQWSDGLRISVGSDETNRRDASRPRRCACLVATFTKSDLEVVKVFAQFLRLEAAATRGSDGHRIAETECTILRLHSVLQSERTLCPTRHHKHRIPSRGNFQSLNGTTANSYAIHGSRSSPIAD